jgi:transposase
MSIFLAHSSEQFTDEHCVLLLDGAGWHKANDLVIPANMAMVTLPPNSPELNPAEHVWEYTRENDIRNQVLPDLDNVMAPVEISLRFLHESPNSSVPWWPSRGSQNWTSDYSTIDGTLV